MKTSKNDATKNVNAKRKRISVDEMGKPILNNDIQKEHSSPADFKQVSLKEK